MFVRAWVWVGGSIKIFEQKATKSVYVFNLNMSPSEMPGHNMTCLLDLRVSIVTAHKFFVLPNNHPFNHNLSKACSACRT